MRTLEQVENNKKKEKRRSKRERFLIVLMILVFATLTFFEIRFYHFGDKLTILNSLLFYGFKNFSILLVLILVFLITRNIIKTYIERRKSLPGSKLRTKLVLVFMGFSVIPTVILFILSAFFIHSSFDRWFSLRIERTFKESMDVANYLYKSYEDSTLKIAAELNSFIIKERLLRKNKNEYLNRVLRDILKNENMDSIELYFLSKPMITFRSEKYKNIIGPFRDYTKDAFNGKSSNFIEHGSSGDIIRGIVPIYDAQNEIIAALSVSKFIPLRLAKKLMEVRTYYNDYTSIKPLEIPLKTNYLVILLIMTLMILFGASWFGVYLSRQITTPITEIVEGTEAIANGNLDVRVVVDSQDEMGRLVNSFNKMAEELKINKSKLDGAYNKLKISNTEILQKQEYIEIVLRNVSTGVIAINRRGVITTVNYYAQRLLNVKPNEILGRSYRDYVRGTDFEVIYSIISEMHKKNLSTIDRDVVVRLANKELFLKMNLTLLKSLDNKYIGVVVVFDDLTELQKTQRIAAWREVARRIAHEIKNPLTPIQLSAQRLYKKYIDMFDPNSKDHQVFTDCTNLIVDQVDSLKNMVNEFANFARMPTCNPKITSLDSLIKDVIAVYANHENNVKFEYHNFSNKDDLYLDKDQMKRVFINLIDNSISALEKIDNPEIKIIVSNNDILDIAIIELMDNGPGLPYTVLDRLFEPYCSTKGSHGTGLGLTIVKQIITDHSGYIRVASTSNGAKFIIELPLRRADYPGYYPYRNTRIKEESEV